MNSDGDNPPPMASSEPDPVAVGLDLIDKLFLRTPVILQGEHSGAGAQRIVSDMSSVVSECLAFAVQLLQQSGIKLVNSNGTSALYQQFREIVFVNHLSVMPAGRDVHITGNIACIRRDRWDTVKPQLEGLSNLPDVARTFGRYFLAKLIEGFRAAQNPIKAFPDDLLFDIAIGASLLTSRHHTSGDQSRVPLDQTIENVRLIEARVTQNLTDLADLQQQGRSIRGELMALSSVPDEIRSKVEEYRNQASSALEAFRLQIGLDETGALWRQQASHGRRAYFGSLVFLIAAFVLSACLIWIFSGKLIAFLGEIEAFTAQPNVPAPVVYVLAIGRLLLITGPIALLIWAAKLIVRFNLRSLLLMDDASHRVTMLDTYLFLVTKEAATMQDRGALLEAMFRRAPGHGPETVEPPNMADIMRYGDVVGGGQQRN